MRNIIFFLLFINYLTADTPKIIIFDYGGVVAKVDRKPVIEFVSRSLNLPFRKVKKDFRSEKLYKAFNEPHSFWENYSQKSLPKSWFEELDRHKNEIIQPIPGMRNLILNIKAQGIQVALLSNTNKYRARFLETMGGYNLFNPILLSCHLGVKKPNPQIYKKLLEHIEWNANECFFIDNQWKNIEAAKRIGIDGIVFESVDQLEKVLKGKINSKKTMPLPTIE